MKLKDYIRGNKKGKEAHRIERDALKDPFLYEALEGFDDVPGDHAKLIEDLQEQITKATRPAAQRSWLQWSAAASILLLVSFGGYLLLTDREKSIEPLLSQNFEVKTPEYQPKETIQTERAEQTVLAIEQAEQEELSQDRSKVIARDSQEKQVQSSVISDIIQVEQEVVSAEISIVAEAGRDSSIRTISGRITDQYGQPLAGAYIMQKGTTVETSSNADGRFEMKLDSIKDLHVNYIGYIAQEIPVTQFSNSMNITLLEDKTALAETIVVAYGIAKKSNMTGTVSSVDTKELDSKSEPVIGKRAYNQYLEGNMIHPTNEQGKRVKGKVKLSFYINTEGRPINIIIEKSLSDAADAEAIRLIKEGANWTLSNKKVEWTISF